MQWIGHLLLHVIDNWTTFSCKEPERCFQQPPSGALRLNDVEIIWPDIIQLLV